MTTTTDTHTPECNITEATYTETWRIKCLVGSEQSITDYEDARDAFYTTQANCPACNH